MQSLRHDVANLDCVPLNFLLMDYGNISNPLVSCIFIGRESVVLSLVK